jgi:hypothetical protein
MEIRFPRLAAEGRERVARAGPLRLAAVFSGAWFIPYWQ